MPSKKRCRLARFPAKPALGIAPAPQSSEELLVLLKCAAAMSPDNATILTHLTKVGALFPRELFGAFQAFLKKQNSDN